MVNGSFTVYVTSVHSWTHHHIWFYLCVVSAIINACPSWLPPSRLSMAGLQRAAVHARDARCSGDVDRQGSHPHQCETTGDAAGFLQISAAEHQTPRRRCAPHLVGTFLFCSDSAAFLIVPFCLMDIWFQRIVLNHRADYLQGQKCLDWLCFKKEIIHALTFFFSLQCPFATSSYLHLNQNV